MVHKSLEIRFNEVYTHSSRTEQTSFIFQFREFLIQFNILKVVLAKGDCNCNFLEMVKCHVHVAEYKLDSVFMSSK